MNLHIPNTTFSYLRRFCPLVQDLDMVRDAMTACALICFGRFSEQPGAAVVAREYYGRALSSVGQALRVPELIIDNATLLCLLLLLHFEAITFSGQRRPIDWANHLHGLNTLLCLRDETQFTDEFGQKLFAHASTQVLTHSLQQRTPIPEKLKQLQVYASKVLGLEHFGLLFGQILSDAATLRATMEGRPTTELVEEILRLDKKSLEVLNKVSLKALRESTSSPQIISDVVSPQTSADKFHSLSELRQWNNVLLLRLCFQEWLFDVLESETHRTSMDQPRPADPLCGIWRHLKAEAFHEFQKIAEEILASVPMFILFQGEPPYPANRFMLCPLVTVATSKLCTSKMKTCAINALQRVGVGYDMEQVKEVLRLLKCGRSLERWYDHILPCWFLPIPQGHVH